MEDASPSTDRSRLSESTAVAALAKETSTSPEIVRDLYHQEVATLGASAKVRNFIGIIAGRRVKQRLIALRKRSDIYGGSGNLP
jgi:hypothetical protein